jgi:hypothetical protein
MNKLIFVDFVCLKIFWFDALIVTRFLLHGYLCRISESGHSWQHYKHPFGSKSHWEFPASECRLGYNIIIIITTNFLKQFVCPAWSWCGLQVNEKREYNNGSSELFPWSSDTKEFLFTVKNNTDTMVQLRFEHRMICTCVQQAVCSVREWYYCLIINYTV